MPILTLSESYLKGEEYFYSFITEHYQSDSIVMTRSRTSETEE